ncbi:hypothetical protein [Nakamurella deserti]|uniref:hypothetical protein n=1 Tax=Nakamurella deserti TaxID=2164074 RepID=UPI000DBE5AFB|nr:hypothetical protein [Nakamurella deserti]
MFARLLARIVVLAVVCGLIGLAVGLVGKYALDWSTFENPFWAVAVGAAVGAVLGVVASIRVESARRRAAAPRR